MGDHCLYQSTEWQDSPPEGKNALYDNEKCPRGLGFQHLRNYHDLSLSQLEWKLWLRTVVKIFVLAVLVSFGATGTV